ncbi:hypothetical protein VM1G_12013 [Cytospora mali]|uniref:Uncharacterized protein n=1 Tax=Cytospora mali TaxID=578113 RepID=A0A194VIS9_CYTMA|nr:hypothetical protein VM1G_12013 [Valsa mali]
MTIKATPKVLIPETVITCSHEVSDPVDTYAQKTARIEDNFGQKGFHYGFQPAAWANWQSGQVVKHDLLKFYGLDRHVEQKTKHSRSTN